MTNPRTARVQGLRRSNAAGPHGTGRRPALDARQAAQEALEDFNATQLGNAIRQVAEDILAATDGRHELVALEPDYGVRFVCSCGEVSPYYTSKANAEAAHAEHVNPGPVTPGTTVLD